MISKRPEFSQEGPIGITSRHIFDLNLSALEAKQLQLARRRAMREGDFLLGVLEEINLEERGSLKPVQRQMIEQYRSRYAPYFQAEIKLAGSVALHDVVLEVQWCILHGQEPFNDQEEE